MPKSSLLEHLHANIPKSQASHKIITTSEISLLEIMGKIIKILPRITQSTRNTVSIKRSATRSFSSATTCYTDGVYKELTAMRTRIPFIDAFRKQQQDKTNTIPILAEIVAKRDPSPKSMADSFHRVVSHIMCFLLNRYKLRNGVGC